MWVAGARLETLLVACRRRFSAKRSSPPPPTRVFGFDRFLSPTAQPRRALVSFGAASLVADAEQGRSRYFNPHGAALEMARALNQLGFVVDMIDMSDTDFRPEQAYDLFVGHGNVNYPAVSQALGPQARRANYLTGCYWKDFLRETEACYERFCASRGLPRDILSVTRQARDEDFATRTPELVICLGEETAKTFAPVANRVVAINNAAYLESAALVEKDWAQARRHFLYYGGTGNIQKGVDLLIEAFAAERRCHLHLAAPLEPELLKAYKTELSAPNIHYAHPRRLLPGRLQGIVKRCAFTVLCGFATGQSTALIGSLGSGLIPVVNREADIGNTGVRIKETSVAGVRAAICRAAELGPTELAALQRDAVDRFRTCHTPDAFRLGFRNAISSLFCA